MVKRFILIFLISIVALFVLPGRIHASNFTTDSHATYTVSESGMTNANLSIVLTNTTGQFYATTYTISMVMDNISNVRAWDPGGPIDPEVTKEPDGYKIKLNFNHKAVGLGSKNNFHIVYDSPSLAKRYGKMWKINIPGIKDPDAFNTFSVDIKTPSSFGKASFIKPYQKNDSLFFTKEQLGAGGISIAFGDRQYFTFHLIYHLQNKNLFPQKTEIALPPTTNYQNIYITGVNPMPTNVIKDKDGNWLAQYKLMPSQSIEVLVDGKAELLLNPKEEPLSSSDFALYTSEKPYWQSMDPKIRALAQDLGTPQAIYDYVIKTLKYDFARVKDSKSRLGGVDALRAKAGACREFTDLFISIARAAGIPARQVEGFAYSENPRQRPLSLVRDLLHSWPEYYDIEKKTWVMVDPTWGNTTGGMDYFSVLDFDHLAFVVKGVDSSYPVPAGGYKLSGNESQGRDVIVEFTDSVPMDPPEAFVSTSFPKSVIAGLPLSGKAVVRNNGQSQLPEQLVYVSSETFSPGQQMLTLPDIPPFGYATAEIKFKPTMILTKKDGGFTIRLTDKSYNQLVNIVPFFMNIWGIGGSFGILTIIILILAYKGGRLHIPRPGK